jgi:hypothetical protein
MDLAVVPPTGTVHERGALLDNYGLIATIGKEACGQAAADAAAQDKDLSVNSTDVRRYCAHEAFNPSGWYRHRSC